MQDFGVEARIEGNRSDARTAGEAAGAADAGEVEVRNVWIERILQTPYIRLCQGS